MTSPTTLPRGLHAHAAAGHLEKQARALAYIGEYIQTHGYPPSVRDITRGCSLSSTSVTEYVLLSLKRRGLISRDRNVSRGLRLLVAP